MIWTKHFMEPVSDDDGIRLWVEPIGVTRDLRQWCRIDAVLRELAPPPALAARLEGHPEQYERFRRRYARHLRHSALRPALSRLAELGTCGDITLLHQSSDTTRNTAAALAEIVRDLPHSDARRNTGPLRWLYRILWRDVTDFAAARPRGADEPLMPLW